MMKIRILLLCLVLLPALASAEIYKWKDKEGKVRYSDVPPPSNIPQESLYGEKIPMPTGQPPLAPVEGDATAAANREKAAEKGAADKAPVSKAEAAAKRAKEAEQQKKKDEAKQADLKLKQENCKAARASLKTYSDGGRLVRTNEKGEREYLGDAAIAKGKVDAQEDVDTYCDAD